MNNDTTQSVQSWTQMAEEVARLQSKVDDLRLELAKVKQTDNEFKKWLKTEVAFEKNAYEQTGNRDRLERYEVLCNTINKLRECTL